jgi:hypothetical protein
MKIYCPQCDEADNLEFIDITQECLTNPELNIEEYSCCSCGTLFHAHFTLTKLEIVND